MLHPDERFVTVLTGNLETPDTIAEFFFDLAVEPQPFQRRLGPRLRLRHASPSSSAISRRASTEPAARGRPCRRKSPRAPCSEPTSTTAAKATSSAAGTRAAWAAPSPLCATCSYCWRCFCSGAGLRRRRRRYRRRRQAFSAFEIQQAHFYTVDSFTNLLVMLTLYFCARLIARPGFVVGAGESSVPVGLEHNERDRRSRPAPARAAARITSHWSFDALMAGTPRGLAAASKLNAVLLVPVIVVSIASHCSATRGPGCCR